MPLQHLKIDLNEPYDTDVEKLFDINGFIKR